MKNLGYLLPNKPKTIKFQLLINRYHKLELTGINENENPDQKRSTTGKMQIGKAYKENPQVRANTNSQ